MKKKNHISLVRGLLQLGIGICKLIYWIQKIVDGATNYRSFRYASRFQK